MSQDQAPERKSIPLSAGGGAPTLEQIASLTHRVGHSMRLLTLELGSASASNVAYSVLKDTLQVMQKQLGERASLYCAKMEPYQQLIEGGLHY